MSAPPPPLRRRPPERLAAWIVTGPLGHLWSVTADLAAFLARTALARAQRRLAGAGSRSSARR